MNTIQFPSNASPMMQMSGYEPKTTFWSDFTIADKYGVDGIEDTFNRAFKEWKNDYIYLTELVMVLNHKIWQWYERDEDIAQVYHNLWVQADEYACNNLKGEEAQYFYNTLD